MSGDAPGCDSRQNEGVLATIYPDTNAFFADPTLRRKYSKDFLAVLEPGVVEVRLSPVVVAETRRHTTRSAAEAVKDLRKAIQAIAQNWSSATDALRQDADEIAAKLQVEGDAPLRDLLENAATTVLGWPSVSAEHLVKRELDGRRPTKLHGDQTVGLRDTVIWHSILEDLDLTDVGSVAILVTKDRGFLSADGSELHPDLVQDLEAYEVELDRLVVRPDLAGATLEAQIFTQRISTRDAMVQEAFLDYLRSIDKLSWFGRFDPRDGGWITAETAPAEAPRYLEEGQVLAVDIEDIEPVSNGSPIICVGHVVVTFEGSMPSYEYFSGDYDVELYDGAIEDHYVSVTTWKRVRVEAQIEVDSTGLRAEIVHASFEWD